MRHLPTLALTAWLLALAVAWAEPAAPEPIAAPAESEGVLDLADLIRIGLDSNPALRQAGLDVDAEQGRALQAGRYPNPTVTVIGEELGGRDGPGGFITAPMVSQEIVTCGKLKLSRAVAQSRVDQTGLALIHQRFNLYTAVRQGYFEVLAAQRRVDTLAELAKIAGEVHAKTKRLLDVAKQGTELEVLLFQVERDRFLADLDAGQRELTAARQRLMATVGAHQLPLRGVRGSLEAVLPDYEFEPTRGQVIEEHPEILSARVGVTRAELALRREHVERVPNVTVAAGYTRDNIGKQNEWTFQVGVPVPLFNRNQGNIQAAHAELAHANQEVLKVENALVGRLATAFGEYSAARAKAARYGDALKAAKMAYKLSEEGKAQLDFLRVLQVQRSLAETDLEYNRALLEAWRAASVIAGLLQEEQWPAPCEEANRQR